MHTSHGKPVCIAAMIALCFTVTANAAGQDQAARSDELADAYLDLPATTSLQAHVDALTVMPTTAGACDMRPLGEFEIAAPRVEATFDPPVSPQPATVALAGLGLATLLTGRFHRGKND
jgi:hypothetical protein